MRRDNPYCIAEGAMRGASMSSRAMLSCAGLIRELMFLKTKKSSLLPKYQVTRAWWYTFLYGGSRSPTASSTATLSIDTSLQPGGETDKRFREAEVSCFRHGLSIVRDRAQSKWCPLMSSVDAVKHACIVTSFFATHRLVLLVFTEQKQLVQYASCCTRILAVAERRGVVQQKPHWYPCKISNKLMF